MTGIMTACSESDSSVEEETNDEVADDIETESNEEQSDEEEIDEENEEAEEEVENDQELEDETSIEPKYVLNENNWSVQPKEDAPENVVLMTIDDAPDEHGHKMAEVLHEHDVPAIFFVNGHFLNDEEGIEQLEEIIDYGFEIGNHTMTHQNLQNITEEEQRQEIIGLSDKLEDLTGERPDFFRAPHGANTDISAQIMNEEQMLAMNWTYGYDWVAEFTEAAPLAAQMVETELLQDGANLLMHDREWSLEALPEIIEGLRDKGYKFVDPDDIERAEEEA
ncbi:polysaccharide deacetylase family protein [Salsuginibacillus halophilus]|nr:polysaccharide deacetylase family protein [Salsuginibacillus halophilus]